jgi:uncharacterized membrane protein YczE
VKLFIDAGLGVDPLHAMVIGIAQTVDLPFMKIGLVASMVTLGFLAVWTAWNRRLPPVTTFLTMAVVTFAVDLWNLVGLEQHTRAALSPVPMMFTGLLLDAYGSALITEAASKLRDRLLPLHRSCPAEPLRWSVTPFRCRISIMSGLGIRVMDLVAISMMRRWRLRFFACKLMLEGAFILTVWIFGGPIGLATVAFLCLVGPFMEPMIWANRRVLRLPIWGFWNAADRWSGPERTYVVKGQAPVLSRLHG